MRKRRGECGFRGVWRLLYKVVRIRLLLETETSEEHITTNDGDDMADLVAGEWDTGGGARGSARTASKEY